MLEWIRVIKGLGNAEEYLRLRGGGANLGKFWDWTGLAWVTPQTANCKKFLAEYADSDPAKSFYAVEFTPPPDGAFVREIVRNSTGAVEDAESDNSFAFGVITAFADMGVAVSSVFKPVVMEKGENKALSFRAVDANGASVNCAGYTAKLGVKDTIDAAVYKIGPLAGVLSAYSDGVLCVWTFTLAPAVTKDMTPFTGKYSAAIYDGAGNGTVLNPGGTDYRLLENIIDI